MNKIKQDKITIIGSGLAGSFLAVVLAQKGYRVELFEKFSREDICDVASKRSYNIVLFGYGINLLKETNLWEDIKPHLLTLEGTITNIAKKTKPIISLIDPKKIPYFTISRARLVAILLEKASSLSSVTIHYNTALVSIDRYNKTITVEHTKTKKIETIPCEVVIGADGANSLVRSFMQQGQNYSHIQEYAEWAYKQFIISSAMVEKLKLRKNFVYDWTQKNAFIIMHPDGNNSLGSMLVYSKNDNFTQSATAIKNFFQENFPQLLPALDEITQAIFTNPDGNFATIHTDPWYYKNFIAIIGDAAHGFYPFSGQGTSAAFGDCIELAGLIEKYGPDWDKIFPLYQESRKKHMDALGELSKEALFRYLRNNKADYNAVYDKLEFLANQVFPNSIYPPLSHTVTTDPGHADDHWQHYLKHKKIAKRLGFTYLISFVTKAICLYEHAVAGLKTTQDKKYEK